MPSQGGYGTSMVAEYTAGGYGSLSRSVEIGVTSAYLGGVPAMWSLTIPDLTQAAGYRPEWGIPTVLGLDYLAVATGGNRLFFEAPGDGQTMSYATREGTSLTNAQDRAALGVRAAGTCPSPVAQGDNIASRSAQGDSMCRALGRSRGVWAARQPLSALQR